MDQAVASLHRVIDVVIEYEGCGLYRVGVGYACESPSIECVGHLEAVRVVRRELENIAEVDDAIEFSGIEFDTIDDAVRAVESALGVT